MARRQMGSPSTDCSSQHSACVSRNYNGCSGNAALQIFHKLVQRAGRAPEVWGWLRPHEGRRLHAGAQTCKQSIKPTNEPPHPGFVPVFSPQILPSFTVFVRVFAVVRVWVLGLPRSGGAGTAPSIRKPARLEVGPALDAPQRRRRPPDRLATWTLPVWQADHLPARLTPSCRPSCSICSRKTSRKPCSAALLIGSRPPRLWFRPLPGLAGGGACCLAAAPTFPSAAPCAAATGPRRGSCTNGR